MKSKQIITSLQVLRTLAFFEVFLYHCGNHLNLSLNKYFSGPLGVSVFFILSGFLMIYNYYDKDLPFDFKSSLFFAINKIKKLYLLYFIMLVCGLIFDFLTKEINTVFIIKEILYLITDSLLLQSLICFGHYSLNGLSWFLSASFFLYFSFPFIIHILKKTKITINHIYILIFIQFLIGLLIYILSFKYKFLNKDEWFTYIFPYYRIGDFLVGCILAINFLNYKINIPKYKATVYEIAVLLLWLISPYLNSFIPENLFFIKWTLFFIIQSSFIVFVFALNKGILSDLLTNNIIVFIAGISGYLYLIHELVIKYLNLLNINKYILIFLSLCISILLSILYKKAVRGKKQWH